MKRFNSLMAVACLFCMALPVWAGPAGDDLKNLQGKWEFTSLSSQGKQQPPSKVKHYAYIENETIYFPYGYKVTFKLNPAKKPQEIDLEFYPGEVARGIYQLSGDKLILAHNEITGERPKSLKDVVRYLATFQKVPETVRYTTWTPEAMLQVQKISKLTVSPDGKQIAFMTEGFVRKKNKWLEIAAQKLYVADAAGKSVKPVDEFKVYIHDLQWSPDSQWLYIAGDDKIAGFRPKDGQKKLVAEPGSSRLRVSPDGKWLAYLAAEWVVPPDVGPWGPDPAAPPVGKVVGDEEQKTQNVIKVMSLVPPAGKPGPDGAIKKLIPGSNVNHFEWSPDNKTLVISNLNDKEKGWVTDQDLALVDVATGKTTPLVKSPDTSEMFPMFSPDGKWVAYWQVPRKLEVEGHICVVSVKDKKVQMLTKTHTTIPELNTDPWVLGWTPDSKALFYTDHPGTASALYQLPLDGKPGKAILADVGVLSHPSMNGDGSLFSFWQQKPDTPPEVCVWSPGQKSPTAITHFHSEFTRIPSGKTEVIKWKSTDNQEIEGLLTYPVPHKPGQRYPLLVILHGGPCMSFQQSFVGNLDPFPVAAFAGRGYAVLRPNVRGSNCYGARFKSAIYQSLGKKDYQDLISGVDHVIQMGLADEKRLGVMGWSYGGYLTVCALTQTKRFKAASVGAGFCNFTSAAGTSNICSKISRTLFGGGLLDQPKLYLEHSPILHLKGVTTPTLIQHGEMDNTVPVQQGHELHQALQQQNCPSRMVTYPGMGHGPGGPGEAQEIMERNLDWFDTHLR